MVSYILVVSDCPATAFAKTIEVSMKTHIEYPAFLKKILDIGGNYMSYCVIQVEDAKIKEGLEIVGKRYHKIASQVEDFTFTIELMMDMKELAKMAF